MAGWRKHWKVVNNSSPIAGRAAPSSPFSTQAEFAFRNYQSNLPDVYTGHPNRIDRYQQYEAMDADSEINAALDIIAEFCSQTNDETKTAFQIDLKEKATDNEVDILKEQLKNWCKLNEFPRRMFKIVRNAFKYGDQIFVRDPETFKWNWVEMNKVTKIVVNESAGKEPETYFIKDLNPNLQNSTITSTPHNNSDSYAFSPYVGGMNTVGSGQAMASNSRFGSGMAEFPVDAQHVVHLSLTEGMDPNWPFGASILETIFKVFKQKELLEDAMLIYRIQRAPERRVFYIDTGNMPGHLAMQFVERIKNEMQQRRIPTMTGGGTSLMDASYSPMGQNEDFFMPVTAEGRGSKVEVLPGGSNIGEINDLQYFTNKFYRGLRIPSSYLPTGSEESGQVFSDGKVTTALIQEHRFNEYCKRLQKHLAHIFDQEFKLFLKWRGFNMDNSMFDLNMAEPQNFAAYRELELNSTRVNTFSGIKDVAYLSKRFMMRKYLQLSEFELTENEKLWKEENDEPEAEGPDGTDLRNVGITPGGIDGDLGSIDEFGAEDMGDDGMPGTVQDDMSGGGMPAADGGMGDMGGGMGGGTAVPGNLT